ncbi:MAG: ribonuclease H family protein [Dysgonamonadaceae bacterium]|jgi:ribonuclease HI|nr:ribonuclease H family protein [Dysgonamonadaceae bacterium]MDD4378982.1 ribonuclease H family protein [Dysgonamonadaceae bacterium]
MAKQKFYVVWQGRKPGIYTSWKECEAQVSGFENAQYKAFDSMVEAEKAFSENPWKYFNIKKKEHKQISFSSNRIMKESVAVDAACSGNPGKMEYRGVYVATGEEIFHFGPLEGGTNNIGEFLGIVHALALLKQQNSPIPVYSDSNNAIKWVKNKKCNTKLKPTNENKYLFEVISRAEKWLAENDYSNPVIKWETDKWGEIPADFGRK